MSEISNLDGKTEQNSDTAVLERKRNVIKTQSRAGDRSWGEGESIRTTKGAQWIQQSKHEHRR